MSFYIPVAQLRNKSLLVYPQYNGEGSRHLKLFRSQNLREQRKSRYSGRITTGARKRLEKAITLLTQTIETKRIYNPITKKHFNHRLSFVTLTITENNRNLTAREAYSKLFQHFLQWLRRTEKVTTYIWKAELQERGQIHYHILTPAFIEWQKIRDKWNNLQRQAGLLDSFKEKYQHDNPNSTDIHETRHIKDLAAYMIKYISKTYQNEEALDGKVWDCSTNLKKNKYFSVNVERFHEELLVMAKQEKVVRVYESDHCKIYRFYEDPAKFILKDAEYDDYLQFLNCIRTNKIYDKKKAPHYEEILE
jgi:Fe-S cluster biosynthesis and repair protein YggX